MKSIVLFVAPIPPPVTGQAIACDLLFNELLRNGRNAQIVNLSKNDYKNGFGSFSRLLEVAKIVFRVARLQFKAKIVYFTVSESFAGNLKDLLIYLVCYRRLGQMVIHLHGGAGMRELLSDKHPIIKSLNRYFLVRIGKVIVLGERLKSIYSDIVPLHKLHSIPNFAGDDFFVDEAVIRFKYSSINPLRLLFLSNLLPGKGHNELLAALSLLPAEVKEILQMDFAGGFETNADERSFRQAVHGIDGVKINVHGIVHGNHKKELLKQAHIFCLPTYYPYEGQPISILEAFASGCAVITTDHSGIFDVFTPSVNGLVVETKSPRSIANAILKLVGSPELLLEFGINNYRISLDKFRTSVHLNAMKKVIFHNG